MIELSVNGKKRAIDADEDTPLLWVIRDILGLTGTKFGCGVALCGACTVHVDGKPIRSCSYPLTAAAGKNVDTIETLASTKLAREGSALQQAWIAHDVPQCGYCQSGMLMAASALLKSNASPTDDDIDKAITNICRCGTYRRIRAAIHTAAQNIRAVEGRA